jgi:peptidoglycan/LPS O-acetylase OafA/YrhL
MYGRVLGVLYALLLLQIVQRQSSPVVAFLDTPVLRHIGLISYGAYLYHLMSFQGLLSILHLPVEAPHLVAVAAEFVLTIIVATASYWLMEQPIRNLARRKPHALPPATPEPAEAGRISGAE